MRYVSLDDAAHAIERAVETKMFEDAIVTEQDIKLLLSWLPQLEITKEYKVQEVTDADN